MFARRIIGKSPSSAAVRVALTKFMNAFDNNEINIMQQNIFAVYIVRID